jgi:hypothetical protein
MKGGVRITGGPATQDIKVECEGKDISTQVLAMTIDVKAGELAKATLTFFAELDLKSEVDAEKLRWMDTLGVHRETTRKEDENGNVSFEDRGEIYREPEP